MEATSRQNIEETVTEILKHADMEKVTEFKVRETASERLGIDLSDDDNKNFVRSVVESFLLSDMETDSNVQEEPKVQQTKLNKPMNGSGDRVICQLSNKRSVAIQEFRGKALVSIREYYRKDGKQLPSAKGISLTSEQWAAFRKCVPAIEEAVMKMQLKLRFGFNSEQNEDVPKSITAAIELFSVKPSRFNGKDYLYWAPERITTAEVTGQVVSEADQGTRSESSELSFKQRAMLLRQEHRKVGITVPALEEESPQADQGGSQTVVAPTPREVPSEEGQARLPSSSEAVLHSEGGEACQPTSEAQAAPVLRHVYDGAGTSGTRADPGVGTPIASEFERIKHILDSLFDHICSNQTYLQIATSSANTSAFRAAAQMSLEASVLLSSHLDKMTQKAADVKKWHEDLARMKANWNARYEAIRNTLKAAEDRVAAAEDRVAAAEANSRAALERAENAEARASDAETKLSEAEARASNAEAKLSEAQMRISEAETRISNGEEEAAQYLRKAEEEREKRVMVKDELVRARKSSAVMAEDRAALRVALTSAELQKQAAEEKVAGLESRVAELQEFEESAWQEGFDACRLGVNALVPRLNWKEVEKRSLEEIAKLGQPGNVPRPPEQ